ncbi:carbohydrate sulfotransferase 11-like isoform X2 [Cherax quadricarinatus]|uniref:carbohydrate sulfotransferase 11-like isoform X2 n=1 Tax=Cherax quadricarinatus TaxID=27406 RepID=UPI00387EC9A3
MNTYMLVKINLKDKSTVEGRTARINQLRELCNSSSTNMKNDQWTINPGITPLSESSRNVVNILTERRKLLQTQCEEKLTPEEKAQPANSNEFLISDKYKLVWCNVFKAASTTWMFNFFIMAGKTEKEFRLSLKTSAVEETRKLYPRPSIEELNDSLTCLNYSSFIIVREPFERLLSSYRDKIESTAQYYFRSLRCTIKNKFSQVNFIGKCIPTFSEFVDYLIDEADNNRPFNEHWAPYYTFCSTCQLHFDYILHFETLSQDEAFLLQAVPGLSEVLSPQKLHNSNTNYEELIKDYFSQLTLNQLHSLLRIYGRDFLFFGYSEQKYFKYAKS